MALNETASRKTFLALNAGIMALIGFLCLLPFVHVIAVSFSSRAAAGSGAVTLFPVEFTTRSYDYVIRNMGFLRSFLISVIRVLLGTGVNMVLLVIVAFPLSRSPEKFIARNFYVWFFIVTMLFSGGLIPTYMMVRNLKLLNTIWALVLPVGVQVFSVILLVNFFRNIPKELEESAYIDGAGHLTTLLKICLPLSRPALATLALFAMVGHWNSWFDGLIYMNSPSRYPLQTYLFTSVIMSNFEIASLDPEEMVLMNLISDRTVKASQIFVAAVPIILVYPFLQKHFVKGIVLGSVKG